MNRTFKGFYGLLIAGVLSLALMVGCGGGGGGGGSTPTPTVTTEVTTQAGADEILISGRAAKGTILNATVRATQIIDGQLSGIQKDVALGPDGDFTVSMPKGLIHLQVIPQANSTTQDEATGVAVALPPEFKFRAAADLTDSTATTVSLNITPFSEAGVALAEKSGGLTAVNINMANSGIANILGFDHLGTTPIQSSDAAALASATMNEKKLSVLNAAVSNMAATDALGCGVQATYGQTIGCTVAKLADQFQVNSAASTSSMKALSMDMAGSTPMVMLGDKGYQSLLGGSSNAVISGLAVLGNVTIELLQDTIAYVTSSYAAAETILNRQTSKLEYQNLIRGDTNRIDIATKFYPLAIMSDLVYEDKWVNGDSPGEKLPPLAGDYTALNWFNYGLDAQDIQDAWFNGLQWNAFYNSDTVVFVYRGTKFTSLADWINNFGTVVCSPLRNDQHSIALRQFQAVMQNKQVTYKADGITKKRIVVTGHSLGGGIAAYIAKKETAVDLAVVFNSAGLCNLLPIIAAQGPIGVPDDEKKIYNLRINGEILWATTALGVHLPGNLIPYPSPYPLALANQFDNHSMSTVRFALDAAKDLCSTIPSCAAAQNTAQPIQTPVGSNLPLAVTGIQSSYSTGVTPYRPAVSLSGTNLSAINQISWACTQPNGTACPGSPYVWTPNDWAGKVDITNDTSIKVYPRLLNLGDATGTYNWTATFTALNAIPISIPFSVVYQPPATATAPSVTYFKINNDASSTPSRTVTLNNSATDSPTHYMASESSSFSGAGWQTYSTAPSFTLSSGDVTKTVYFKVKNSTGESTVVSDFITLNEATTSQYTLTVSKSGTGSGTVSATGLSCSGSTCTGSYSQGTSVTLSASASSGSTFAGWSGGGCSGTGTCTVTMDAAKTVTATFNSDSTPTVSGISPSTFSSSSTPYSPVITVSGTYLDQIASVKYSWTGAISGGPTTGAWASAGTTSRTLNPTVLTSGDPSGISTWTVRFYNSSGSEIAGTSKTFTVTYSPTTTPTVTGISPTTFTSSSTPYAPVITVSGTNLDQIPTVRYSWTGPTSGTALGAWESSGTTSRTLKPTVLTSGDPSGTYTWTVRFYNSSGSEIPGTSKTFTVTYSPTSTTTHTLTINSTGVAGGAFVSVTTDNNGLADATAPFTRTYNHNTAVTIATPNPWNGATFSHWLRDGSVLTTTSGTLVTMDADHTMTAVYSSTGGTQVERITNGSFSSGTSGWTLSGDFWAGTNLTRYYTSPGYASGGVDSAGAVKNYASGYMYQTVTIPSNATSATLSFQLNITSDETGSAYDYLYVEILNSSGALLTTPFTFSNVDKGPYCGATCTYSQKTANLLSFKGQTIRVKFRATTDIALSTVFRIDDVSLMADGN